MDAAEIEGTFAEPDLVLIPADKVVHVLPLVMERLNAIAARSSGSLSVNGMLQKISSGEWQLWLIDDGERSKAVMLTELHIQLSGRKSCLVRALTGEDSLQWIHLVEKLEAWAKAQGCEHLEMIARRGWASRLPEYRLSHVHLEKELI